MRGIPEPYVAPPAGMTPWGLIRWVCRLQWRSIVAGTGYDVVWLLGLALTPWAIGQVIDQGLVAGDAAAFGLWMAVVVWLQLQHSLIQGLRDRAGILNWRRGFSRVDQLVTRTAARNGTAAERSIHPGAIVTMAMSDSMSIAFVPIMIGALASSVVAYLVVGALLLYDSPLLGAIVLVGVPVFSGLLFVLIRPLRERQSHYREALERMNTVGTDSVRGLRVLRGMGAERQFLARYLERSAAVREAGMRIAWPLAGVDAIKVIVSGALVVGLTWIGAALVVQGQLRIGELVAFYGYAGFMVLPVTLVGQAISTTVQALVGARKIVDLLDVEPLVAAGAVEAVPSVAAPEGTAAADSASGLLLRDGELLAVVSATDAAPRGIADRLARLVPDDPRHPVFLGRANAAALPLAEVRRRVVVADAVPFLFAGTLRYVLDAREAHDDATILAALAAADAGDVLEAAADGLDTIVGERGIQFSGGQRQRIGLARALLAAPELLVLLEPTSSVDAPTEARMAAGIRAFRAGAPTLISTTSPLVLTETERVVLLADDSVVRGGAHAELMRDDDYRRIVLRGEGL